MLIASAEFQLRVWQRAGSRSYGSEYQEGINEEVLIRNSRDILVSQNAII